LSAAVSAASRVFSPTAIAPPSLGYLRSGGAEPSRSRLMLSSQSAS
jgi:hypothetical protein